MVRIAVASENNKVAPHFGHCSDFNIFEVEGGRVMKCSTVPNPGHKPGFLPDYLSGLGVTVIISGGIGDSAVEMCDRKGIEVLSGVTGSARAAVERYAEGTLRSTGAVCQEHEHRGECGEHHDH